MKHPVALFNGLVVTTNGVYYIDDIDIQEAKRLIKESGFISAIGHEATAQIMSSLLEEQIPMNRIEFKQDVEQIAIILKLNIRPEEGRILNKDEMERIGYTLKIMKRLE